MHRRSLLAGLSIRAILVMGPVGALASVDARATETLAIFAEENPPLSWRELDGRWRGIAADRVIELLRRSGQPYRLELLPWKRAYNDALRTPNGCVFGTGMTPERQPLFKWVHPIAQGGVSLYVRADERRAIVSIEDLIDNKLTVAVKGGDVTEAVMSRYPGVALQSGAEDDYGLKKLMLGRVDVWASGHASGLFRAKQLGVKIKRVLDVQPLEIGLACNPAIPDDTIRAMSDALRAMWTDGTAQAMEARYESN